MKRILLLSLFILSALLCKAQIELSQNARISAITCGPGQNELYSAFGHSAFRVYDSVQHIDAVFNYGIFSFNQPYFYLNFTRGYLYYMVAAYDYRDFEIGYLAEGRYVHEQVLNLTQEQNQKLFNYLENNVLPQNATYRYDYFYNNCATKIRDVLIASLGDDVTFDLSFIKTDYTIRQLTDLYIEEQQPWGDLGIDICLGLPMDKTASPYEYMFLPDYIESCFNHATVKQNGETVPLVKATKNGNSLIHHEWSADEEASVKIHPLYFMMAFLAVCMLISFMDWNRKKLSNWFDAFFFAITGLIGILLAFLWFFTDHNAAARNLNLLWAFPPNFFVAILIVRKKYSWIQKYFLFITVLSAATLVLWKFLPQDLHYALIPLVTGIGLRAFLQYFLRKNSAA